MPPLFAFGGSPVSIVNLSNCVNNADGASMTTAISSLVPGFCKDWNIPAKQLVYVPSGKTNTLNPASLKVFIMDLPDISGADAYKALVNNTAFCVVYAQTILNVAGAPVLYENTRTLPTVSQFVSNELFNLLADNSANVWWINSLNGNMIAGEVCDPVAANIVPVRNSDGVIVAVADWILPAWTVNTNLVGPFNHLDTLTAAFALDTKSYVLKYTNGTVAYTYGNAASTFIKSYSSKRGRFIARGLSVKTA